MALIISLEYMLSLIEFVFFSDVLCANCLGGRFSENKNLIFFAISRTVLVVQRKSFAMILGSSPAVILVAMSSFSICVNRARRVNFSIRSNRHRCNGSAHHFGNILLHRAGGETGCGFLPFPFRAPYRNTCILPALPCLVSSFFAFH